MLNFSQASRILTVCCQKERIRVIFVQLVCSIVSTPFDQVDRTTLPSLPILTHVYEFCIQILPILMSHLLVKSFSDEKHSLDQMPFNHFYFFDQILLHILKPFSIFFSIIIFVLLHFFYQIANIKVLCNIFLTEIL